MGYCYFVYVSSYEKSELVQKKLFKLGYRWVEQSTKVLKIKNAFIYSYSNDKSILYYNHNLDSLIKRDFKEDTIFKKFFKSNLELG